MAVRINDTAPDSPPSDRRNDPLPRLAGDGYAILFSHPRDFTPVCTTVSRGGATDPEWQKRNTKVTACRSTRSRTTKMEARHRGLGRAGRFPDHRRRDLTVAKAYDMLPADYYLPTEGRTPAHSATVRTVYIIGPDKKVRLTLTYPMSVGRNFGEILRALDAVQATDGVPFATPANWVPGQDVIVATSVPTDQAVEKFGPLDIKLPYLRYAKRPA